MSDSLTFSVSKLPATNSMANERSSQIGTEIDAFPSVYQASTHEPTQASAHESRSAAPAEWMSENHDALLKEVERCGALLFRGFGAETPEDFDRLVSSFGLDNFPYEQSLSNAVRVNFTPRVFSANEAPPEVTIYLHHEMAQTPIYPRKIFFCCLQPAEEGGATPLCRSDLLFDRIAAELPSFAEECEQKGLKYRNVMPAENDAGSGMGRSWQNTFRAETRGEAERRLQQLGYSWEWLPDQCLSATTPVLSAVRVLPDGRRVFFNQLIAAFRGWKDSRNDPSKSITFGDGSPMNRDQIIQVADMAEELSFDLEWQAGDIALVDNMLVMHGRRNFRGSRRVLASLADAQHA